MLFNNSKRLIVITGAHRAGTTWTAKILGSSNNIKYIYEPFFVGLHRSNSPLSFNYEYISPGDTSEKVIQIKEYLDKFINIPFYSLADRIYISRRIVTVGMVKRLVAKRYNWVNNGRPLIKDPFAIFSSEWIYQNYPSDILVIIRHPAALISSYMFQHWNFDFNSFKNQPSLIEKYFPEYGDLIDAYSLLPHHTTNIIDQGILLYNIIYSTVLKYQEKYRNEWSFLRNEDLSRDPMAEYQKIFAKFELPFTENSRRNILLTTNGKKSGEWIRNSRENINIWKQRLTKQEVHKIRSGTENVAGKFYTSVDW